MTKNKTSRSTKIFLMLMILVYILQLSSFGSLAVIQENIYEVSYSRAYLADNSAAYSTIYTALSDSASQIDVSSYSLTREEATELYFRILYEDPDLFYVQTSIQYSYNQHDIVQYIVPSYTMSGSALTIAKQRYATELANIVDSVNASWSDLEKVMYVNDYFAINYKYDSTLTIADAYSLFIGKTGVCQAYTLAFIAVMNELGILVTYALSEDMNHTWNLVSVGGQWYHIDVTWNDPTGDMPGRAGHGNFLLSDTAIQATNHHDWVADYDCTSTKYDNYFWKDVNTPFINNNGSWYYIKKSDSALYRYNFSTNASMSVFTIQEKWPSLSNPGSYWVGCFSGLGTYNDILYYNTATKVYAYNPANGSTYAVYTHNTESNNLYYITISGSTLTYYLYTSPNSASVGSGAVKLGSVTTQFTITYKVASLVYKTQTYMVGDTVTPPTNPQKSGYDFTGWNPVLPLTMPANNLTVSAMFTVSICQHTSTHQVTTAATCTTNGKIETICDDCGAVISTTVILATGHTQGSWITTKQPTCSDSGTKVQKCTVCGVVIATQTIPATGDHTYGDWVIVKQPTQTETGLKQKTCTVCGDVISEAIPKLTSNEESEINTSTVENTSGSEESSINENSDTESQDDISSQNESEIINVSEQQSETSENGSNISSEDNSNEYESYIINDDNDNEFNFMYILIIIVVLGIIITLVIIIVKKMK
ncbi:MAG: hypothetical protein A2Y17_00965 [Clostridiales bacterium GWF2_38_85]|nr:MAG: hypothetical protein A2Y17_00965 [Clostridiales bacterium GWF2_38_85]HBL84537.1 hypothetical protein [Clostridiales bacterium]